MERMLAENLKRLRKAARLTQVELAREAGTTQRNIWALEAATYHNPGLNLLKRIAGALGVEVGVLLT